MYVTTQCCHIHDLFSSLICYATLNNHHNTPSLLHRFSGMLTPRPWNHRSSKPKNWLLANLQCRRKQRLEQIDVQRWSPITLFIKPNEPRVWSNSAFSWRLSLFFTLFLYVYRTSTDQWRQRTMVTTILNAIDLQLECNKRGKITENYASINLKRAYIHNQPVALNPGALLHKAKRKRW